MKRISFVTIATFLAVVPFGSLTPVPSAASHGPAVIRSCTEKALDAAVKAGGSYVFGCSGTIALSAQIQVPSHDVISLSAGGNTVTLAGGPASAFSRIFLVRGGTLSLTGLTLVAQVEPNGGPNGSNGAVGSDGASGSLPGDPGKNGTAGGNGGNGKNGSPARGGAMLIQAGSHVSIARCTFKGDLVAGASGGTGGVGGTSGSGGRGQTGSTGQGPLRPGGRGGHGGNGAAGGDGGYGGNGGAALGGAIYNLGDLTIVGSSFVNDLAAGGRGGQGGAGGSGGKGGDGAFGGSGGSGSTNRPGSGGKGGLGGSPGRPGNAGSAGKNGVGGVAAGGAIYSEGPLVVRDSSFTGDSARGGVSSPGGRVAGNGGGGGIGGTGGLGGFACCSGSNRPGNGGDGQPGTVGADGGYGSDGSGGGSALGGSIYAVTLTARLDNFSSSSAWGGNGSPAGDGGAGGQGGSGGSGGFPGGGAPGGTKGKEGAGGNGGNGGDGGKGGKGSAAVGGAVFVSGRALIGAVVFGRGSGINLVTGGSGGKGGMGGAGGPASGFPLANPGKPGDPGANGSKGKKGFAHAKDLFAQRVLKHVVALVTASLPRAKKGQRFSTTLAAADGTKPYHWSVSSGLLPRGLTLNAATGTINGRPSTARTSFFTISVRDSSRPPSTDSRPLSITVAG